MSLQVPLLSLLFLERIRTSAGCRCSRVRATTSTQSERGDIYAADGCDGGAGLHYLCRVTSQLSARLHYRSPKYRSLELDAAEASVAARVLAPLTSLWIFSQLYNISARVSILSHAVPIQLAPAAHLTTRLSHRTTDPSPLHSTSSGSGLAKHSPDIWATSHCTRYYQLSRKLSPGRNRPGAHALPIGLLRAARLVQERVVRADHHTRSLFTRA